MCKNINCRCEDMRCKNELNLDKLCVECFRTHKIKAKKIITNDLCAQHIDVKDLSAENEIANDICVSGTLQASHLMADSGIMNKLCVTNANITNACIANLTSISQIPCTTYRATVNYSADTTYILGAFLNFDNIVDDPSASVSLAPTTYTAPKTGYYMLTYKVNITNVVSTNGPVLGIPVANPEIYVNGLLVREAYSPFLAFFSTQKVMIDSLITLQMGDQVTMKYNILGGNGIAVTGTVDIVGAGNEDGNSLFKIIFLTSLCSVPSGDQPECPPCPEVFIDCDPVKTPCLPCHDGDMMPMRNRQQNSYNDSNCESCQ